MANAQPGADDLTLYQARIDAAIEAAVSIEELCDEMVREAHSMHRVEPTRGATMHALALRARQLSQTVKSVLHDGVA